MQRDDSIHSHGHMTQLTTPETSTIMLRRNSALAHNKDGSATTPKSLNTSFEAKQSPGAVGKKPGFVHQFGVHCSDLTFDLSLNFQRDS